MVRFHGEISFILYYGWSFIKLSFWKADVAAGGFKINTG